jgi:ATP-binding cassette subfamily B protein
MARGRIEDDTPKGRIGNLVVIWRYAIRYKWTIAGAAVGLLIAAAATLAIPDGFRRVIDRGFTAAYVERGMADKGPIYRVRVKFDSEIDARAAEPKLKEFSKDVWITSK